MATIETGFFILLSIMAFGFLVYSLKFDLALAPVIRLFSILLFFVIGLYLVSGYGVQTTIAETQTDGTTTWNSTRTDVMIAENSEGFWFGYIYIAFGFIAMFMMYLDFFRG